ncbi:MAG: hypothetical protein WC965_06045 [Thiohalomonadaceae bacterium]
MMVSETYSKEEQILRAVKITLTCVIKDTATKPGIKHPLSDSTIEDLRQCLFLIAAREQELALEAGRPMNMRPHMPGDTKPKAEVVVPLHTIKRDKQD